MLCKYLLFYASFLVFSFYCSGDSRDLHSFPTRRLPIWSSGLCKWPWKDAGRRDRHLTSSPAPALTPRHITRQPLPRSEEHTSELQSHSDLVCRLLLEKKKDVGTSVSTNHEQLHRTNNDA